MRIQWIVKSDNRAMAFVVCLTLWALVIAGCQSTHLGLKRHWNAESIESFGSVAGKWTGMMVRVPRSRGDDLIHVTIDEDGRYEFASYRTIGVFSGRGQFTLADGKLTVTTERGTATGSLFTSDGARSLRFLGVMKDGTEYTAELEPAKK